MLPLLVGLRATWAFAADTWPPEGIAGNFHNDAKFGAHANVPRPEAHRQLQQEMKTEILLKNEEYTPAHHHGDRRAVHPQELHLSTTRQKNIETTDLYPLDQANHQSTSGSHEQMEDEDTTWLMQTDLDQPAWLAYLSMLREKLDAMTKVERAMCVDTMIRRLDWHATDSLNGYFLGHMGGRTASLTALLVAFKDEVEVDTEAGPSDLVEGMWNEATYFIPAHPGSRRHRGLRMAPEEPTIMLSPREIPSELLTPGVTPPCSPAEQQEQPARKKTCLRIELSASVGRDRQTTGVLRVPMETGSTTLQLRVQVQEGSDNDTTETVPADSPPRLTETLLPHPAPGSLAHAGMSLLEYWRTYEAWTTGTISATQLTQTYGAQTAELLLRQWRDMNTGQAVPVCQDEGGLETSEDKAKNQNEATDQDTEEAALLTLPMQSLVVPLVAGMEAQGMAEAEGTMDIIKEHLCRQRGEGTTRTEQASSLYAMMQSRGHSGYLDYFPQLMEEIGLEVDVDLNPRCLPGPTPFLTWVESELWESYLDFYEAASGFESDALLALRGRPTMEPRDREAWRRWAGMPAASRPSRSRSPRRVDTQRTSTRPEPDRDQDNQDVASFMHRFNRGDSRGDDRRRRRSQRGDGGRNRERSRERGSSARGGGREERVRERITRETRRLTPASCPSNEWYDWRPSADARSEPASASTDVRRASNNTGTEMDLLQATGEWFVILGLRAQGDEQVEPANAITKQRQARARTTLAAMTDRDVATMVRALMRLMGMLYIEAARLLTQAQDDRRRGSEMIEVEVDDEESIYMQQGMRMWQPWENLLQDLVAIADQSLDINRGFLQGLRRRITNSLYLQTPRGQQLQATLIAVIPGGDSQEVEICDTEHNEADRVEEWWSKLKSHMELGRDETGASQSSRLEPRPSRSLNLADPGHSASEVEAWEAERRVIHEEQGRDAAEDERAEEEARQEQEDAKLYEEHLAAEEAVNYKNWENWEVLNTPTRPKRRRLLVETSPGNAGDGLTGHRAELDLPRQLEGLQVTLTMTEQLDVPGPVQAASDASRPAVDINNDQYQKAYLSWKRGHISDQGIEEVFGSDWLFLFQVQRDGVGEDTMGGIGSETGAPATTQLDAPGVSVEEGAVTQAWHLPLQPGVVSLELDDESQQAMSGANGTT